MEKFITIIMCSWFALGAAIGHYMVGKPRPVTGPGVAIFGYIVALLLMIGTIYLYKGEIF